MRTLLYVLGTGSEHNNMELRWSLRSADMFFRPDRVVVVGELPYWARNVEHVATRDRYNDKAMNTWHKLATAVEYGNLGRDFVFMCDDQIFLRAFDRLPVFHAGPLEGERGSANYYRRLRAHTLSALRGCGIREPMDHDVHFPVEMQTALVQEMLARFGGSGSRHLICTAYVNYAGADSVRIARNAKLAKWSAEAFDHLAREVGMVSLSDHVLADPNAWNRLVSLFPDPSRWEE